MTDHTCDFQPDAKSGIRICVEPTCRKVERRKSRPAPVAGGLIDRAERQIDLGKRTGSDGGGNSPHNIYVIAAELLSALRTTRTPQPAAARGGEVIDVLKGLIEADQALSRVVNFCEPTARLDELTVAEGASRAARSQAESVLSALSAKGGS